jgi:antirestriction protein ArdC
VRARRRFKTRFGAHDYAAEELVAELGAAFLCAEFGFDGDLRHAGYIASWVELLRADSGRRIISAAWLLPSLHNRNVIKSAARANPSFRTFEFFGHMG